MTRILIVDDDASIRQLVSTLLGLEGYTVDSAADGRAALQRAVAWVPDLILTDMRMPHMDGCELLAAIRATPALGAVRCVLLAGFEDEDAATVQARSLADACMRKPFTRDALLSTLRHIHG